MDEPKSAGRSGYGLLARHYRDLFPLSGGQEGFFRHLLETGPVTAVLDVGCGAGEQLAWFAGRGIPSAGLEPDEGLFREAVRRAWKGLPPELVQAGAAFLPGPWEGRFDLVVCLGNTLPHLAGPGEMESALGGMRRSLKPGGRLAVQTVNFDRVLDAGRADFPVIERSAAGGPVRLLRGYDLSPLPGSVIFTVRLEAGGKAEEARWPLRPVRRDELQGMLAAAGFGGAAVHGGYDRSPWTPAAPGTVAVARKEG